MTAALDIAFADPEPLEAPAPIHAHVLPGNGRRLVVALAGVGTVRADPPPPEFIGTAAMRGTNHVLFLSDESRSWLNGPGVAETVVRLIEDYRDAHRIEEVVLLGNSMGGFMALVLAGLTEVGTVIAFAPQFSMDKALVPGEERWQILAGNIADWRYRDVGALDREGTNYYIFHGDNPIEAQHWLRFPWRRQLNHFIFTGEAHNVAKLLAKRHMLNRVVENAIQNKPRALRLALAKSFLGRNFIVRRREAYQREHPELTLPPGGAPLVVPEAAE